MKNNFLLISFLFISLGSFAQSQPTFGVRAGALSSGFRGNTVSSLNALLNYTNGAVTTQDHTGFYAGLYTDIPLSETVSFEPGLNYEQKGFDVTGNLNLKNLDFIGANAKARLQMNYAEVPLLLKVNTGGLLLFAGPEFSYLTSANFHTTAGALGINILNTNINATNEFNRFDAGIIGGIGYQFSNGLSLTASYDYGLTKLDANSSTSTYNRSLQLGLGINF